MLEEGPEIARRADRVGVLPLAPIGQNRPKTISRTNSYFHLWAHSAPITKYSLQVYVEKVVQSFGNHFPFLVTLLTA